MAIPSTTSLSSPSLRRPTWLRYPLFNRLRFIFEQANHTSIPTPVPLAHHSRKEPQCSTCTRGYANDDLEEAIWRANTQSHLASSATCAANQIRHASTQSKVVRRLALERNQHRDDNQSTYVSLYTLGANQSQNDAQRILVGSLSFQRKPMRPQIPSDGSFALFLVRKSNWRCPTAIEHRPEKRINPDDHQY